MPNSGNHNFVLANVVRDIIGKNGAIHASITARAFAPKTGVRQNPLNNVLDFSFKPRTQTRLSGLVIQRCFPEFITSFGQKPVIHPFNFLSSSAKTSAPGCPAVRPSSYRLIRSRISLSHAASTSLSGVGSTLARMRCAKVKRWSLGSWSASDAIFSNDAAMRHIIICRASSATSICLSAETAVGHDTNFEAFSFQFMSPNRSLKRTRPIQPILKPPSPGWPAGCKGLVRDYQSCERASGPAAK